MVSNYYCQDCDKYINRRFETKHINSKAHLCLYYNIITNKYNIDDVYWCDFEETIRGYMVINYSKFHFFSTVVKWKLNNDDISILVDKMDGYVPLYRFDDSGWIYYRYCNSKKIRDYIFHRATLSDIILYSSTIISDVTITFFSNYKSMTAMHKLQQPRKVLESKILKHIKNASGDDKETKYNFLAREYELLF